MVNIGTNAINTKIQSYSTTNQAITGSPGKTWILKTAIAFTAPDANPILTNANAAPNVGTILANLDNVPDLTSYVNDSQTGVSTVKTKAQTLLADSATTLKNDLGGPLDNAKLDAIDLVNPAVDQGTATLNGVKADLQAQYVKANSYNDTRVIVQYLLVLLYVLPILFITMMGVSRKPRVMKTYNLTNLGAI